MLFNILSILLSKVSATTNLKQVNLNMNENSVTIFFLHTPYLDIFHPTTG